MPTLKKLTFIILLLVGFSVFAQSTPPNPNPPPPGLPIDDYIWLLAIIALAFGVYVFAKEERLKRSHDIPTRNERSAISYNNNTNNSKK